jgi:hypothetical protein
MTLRGGSSEARRRRRAEDLVAQRAAVSSAMRKIWATPQVRRFGAFVEATLDPEVKSVLGSDSFCTSPIPARSPDRLGCS